ncbi:MAG TPA: class I SAM-dependent methyltransferase [Bryobacteraceae bacterium]|jgi:SAM-dependent methyltransferase|nr:class I SAM-dependent methyltransferase [Bryobacteraceae bacterium]
MGRFETSAAFYRHREPYPSAFFNAVAARLGLTRQTRMLDVGCGPGNLAIGFAPLVGMCTAVDREPEMLRMARRNAAGENADITFIESGIEDLNCEAAWFEFVTIGRALHWLPREAALPVLERVIAAGGHIAICGSTATDAPVNAWAATFRELRKTWAPDPGESRYKVDLDRWFDPSRFTQMEDVAVKHRQSVTISDLISRALSFSTSSPAVLGERRPQFEAALREALAPFAAQGALEEELVAKAAIFG